MIREDRRGRAIEEVCRELRDATNGRFVMVFAPRAEIFSPKDQGYLAEFLGIEELAQIFSDGTVLAGLAERPSVVRAGDEGSFYVHKLGPKAFLIVGYDGGESSLGLVRLQAGKVAEDLAMLVERGTATLH